jgi:uncharacterized protein (TIGR01777 family)
VSWPGDGSSGDWRDLVNGADLVINLAGESIASKRWTGAQKARLERSRIDTTRAIVDASSRAPSRPRLLVNASAVGYYGSRGDEILTEQSAPGSDFLARLTRDWEAEAARAADAGIRTVFLRTGIVLARDGGALQQMLLPFRLGVGGRVGSGEQYMSWIHRDDWVACVRWLTTADLDGAVNLVSPEPVTNATFARAAGSALGRPSWLPAPAFALRLALGEMADSLLLASQRAVPARALDAGFTFRYREIGATLRQILRES